MFSTQKDEHEIVLEHAPSVHAVTPPRFTAIQSFEYVTPSHPQTGA